MLVQRSSHSKAAIVSVLVMYIVSLEQTNQGAVLVICRIIAISVLAAFMDR